MTHSLHDASAHDQISMPPQPLSRRKTLAHGVGLVSALALAPLAARGAAAAAACADPKDSLHASLHYVEASPDAQKTCSACAFFVPGSGCGNCQIFNGPVNSKGHCDSWNAKA